MKLTKEYIESLIDAVEYRRINSGLTHCTLYLKCDFVVIGRSICIDPADFDLELSSNIAYQDAFKKLCELENYHAKRIAAED